MTVMPERMMKIIQKALKEVLPAQPGSHPVGGPLHHIETRQGPCRDRRGYDVNFPSWAPTGRPDDWVIRMRASDIDQGEAG
jgi:hypothetical protein